jgi:hypothetical protein
MTDEQFYRLHSGKGIQTLFLRKGEGPLICKPYIENG